MLYFVKQLTYSVKFGILWTVHRDIFAYKDQQAASQRRWYVQRFTIPYESAAFSAILLIIIIISIQPLGQFGQESESSQATGMALVLCILGKFLGVVCHCFPPRLDFPTFAARCLHVRNDTRDPSSERWNYGREWFFGNLPTWRLYSRH